MKKWDYSLLTFYKFIDISEPKHQVIIQKKFLNEIWIKGRIYIGTEWISATISGNNSQLWAYRQFLNQSEYFANIYDIDTKASHNLTSHAFDDMKVKYREEIVVLGHKFTADQIHKNEKILDIQKFKQMIDTEDPNWLIRDMRNDYEWRLWHFKNAIASGTINFKSVKNFINKYKKIFAGKNVVMYCTGGIRCTKLSALLAKEGMQNIYALDGWVVKYINFYDDGNWLGNLYVFDNRVSQYIGSKLTHTTIGICNYSQELTDHCENCRYSLCNARLICKTKRFHKYMWFCSYECYQKSKSNFRIKNTNWDKYNYQQIRDNISIDSNLIHKYQIMVSNYLDSRLADLTRKHRTSQKEDYIDCNC